MHEQLRLGVDATTAPPPLTGTPTAPPDQAHRERIGTDLESTLFVEAGAGSGKTTALVGRVLALIENGIPLENIAAITFTEKAAAELRQRVRDEIEQRLRAEPTDESMVAALRQVDAAAICTLHAFAQRVLFEHPIEAGLPPGVEVLDELASQVDFDERWDDFVPELLGRTEMAAALLIGDVLGIGVSELRSLAQQFESNWDLLHDRLPDAPPQLDVVTEALSAELRAVGAMVAAATDATDQMVELLTTVASYADELDQAAQGQDSVDRLVDVAEQLCRTKPSFGVDGRPFKRKGNKGNWPDAEHLDEVKEALFTVGQTRDGLRATLTSAVIDVLADAIGGFVLRSVTERRAEGRLRFHDLLVLARDVLRSPDSGLAVRATLRDRYQRLLIDEFQDTDPIQVDLAVLMAADTDDIHRDWTEIPTIAGRLFFVGDPKQSIYRFRRADIGTYLEAQSLFGGDDNQVQLSCNFRSTPPIIDWVNRTFARLIQPVVDSQPAYVGLSGVRTDPEVGPGVLVLGAEPDPTVSRAHELRALEAGEVARAIGVALTEGWTVQRRDTNGDPRERPVQLGDITILLPARTSLSALEQALEGAGIPYRAETASLVYSTTEIRDLLMIARAVDDPTDELAVVMALRSPGFGCGDDDLYRHKVEHGGGWNHQQLGSDSEPSSPVQAGLHWMGGLHRERAWLSPAQVLDRIVRERNLLALGVCQHRHREIWRRLRFVTDQARAWTDATRGDLRQYLGWVRLQASDSARVAETVLPETDTDAVRIMTIHASKGLEFPVTVVSGLTTQRQRRHGGVHVVWPKDNTIGYKLGSGNTTLAYEDFVPLDEQLDDHERLRLLYVACTRATDHLVVSIHRAERSNGSLANALADAEAAVGVKTLAVGAAPALADVAPAPALVPAPLPSLETWRAELQRVMASANQSHTVAATTLARFATEKRDDPGLAKGGRDLDMPPWQKGRYGTAVGRAVHAVLQTIDLDTGADLEGTSRAQAAAEGVLGREGDVQALCRSALDSSVVREAAQLRYWREVFVAAPVSGRVLEGYIDLLYETDQGLVVVDYKTDAWTDQGDLDTKVERYRLQAAAYAHALALGTGLVVERAILLFLDATGSTERVVPALAEAVAQVQSLMPEVIAGGEEVSVTDY